MCNEGRQAEWEKIGMFNIKNENKAKNRTHIDPTRAHPHECQNQH